MHENLDEYDAWMEAAKNRIIEVKGNKIHLKQEGPHGFWVLNWDKGQLPDSLRGEYTSFIKAEQAAVAYLATKDKPILDKKYTVQETRK